MTSIKIPKQIKLQMLDDMISVVEDRISEIGHTILPEQTDILMDLGSSIGLKGGPYSLKSTDKMELIDDSVAELKQLAVINDYLSAMYDSTEELPDEADSLKGDDGMNELAKFHKA
ncbi:MAG: hypothetical protein ABF456_12200 [Lacticaseibacillus paracasei]